MSDPFPSRHFEAYLPPGNPTFRHPPFEDAPCRVLISRLSPFRDVDRSIPHLFLFQEVRRALPGAYVDLAFLPGAHERESLDRSGMPYLLGTQSLRPASAFDLVLISNAYTLELINLPYLLLRSGIPLYAGERGPEWPILVLGGSNAMAAQAIVAENGESLVDGIYFGEGEGGVERLVALLAHGKGQDKRRALQQAAAQIDGFWAAGARSPTAKAVCAPDGQRLAIDYPLLNSPEVHTANLQINYGCPAFCSFCFEGYDRKPYREIPLDDLLAFARRLKQAQGVEEINLYSFNFNTYGEIMPLLLELHRLCYRVGIKSQRVDILDQTACLLEAEVEADKRSFTLGIEGISERQRTWLHKSLPTDDVTRAIERLFAARIREVKLFYLLTGHETEHDMAEFRAFVRQLKEIRRKRNPGIRVVFSFGLLVRMPFTPLRYDRLILDEEDWRSLIGTCKSACETNGFEFRLAFDWQVYCVTQVLALGGHWLIEPVIDLARQGYCYDEALPEGYWEELRQRLVDRGHWDDAFLGEKGPDHAFPLDWVSSRIPDAFLYRQYQEASSGIDGGYCLGSQDGRGRCLGCGACIDEAQRAAITRHRIRVPESEPYLSELRAIVRRKRRLHPAYYVLQVNELPAGVYPAFLNATLFRELLSLYPELTDNLLAVRESLFTVSPRVPKGVKRGRYPTMCGESVFALYAWNTEDLHGVLTSTENPHVVGLAEGFTPGVYSQFHLDLEMPLATFAQARLQLEQYLREAYVPYSLRRETPQDAMVARYRFEVPAKGAKKKVVLGGWFEAGEATLRASLEVGSRFDLLAFLERFGPAYQVPYARIRASQIRW